MNDEVEIIVSNSSVETLGLVSFGHQELRIPVDNQDLIGDTYSLALRLIRYIRGSASKIVPGETVRQGMWVINFELDGGVLVASEYDPVSKKFVAGATRALTCLKAQNTICQICCSKFNPPHLDQLIVITDGVENGAGFRGIRYEAPSHMSGWWLLSEEYKGTQSRKETLCVKDLLSIRPDVMPFLALDTHRGFVHPFSWQEQD